MARKQPQQQTLARFFSSPEGYADTYHRSVSDPEGFWSEQGRELLEWKTDFKEAKGQECLITGSITWFAGGELNVADNCVDRHVRAGNGSNVALIWERDEPGEAEKVTYLELQQHVNRMANVLVKHGVRMGDTVTLYMPMAPTAVYAMLACARLGVAHSVVFAGFSAEALATRITDAKCSVVITADQGLRGGKTIPLKKTVDEAIKLCPEGLVKTVLVYQRTGEGASIEEGRDFCLDTELKNVRPVAAPMAYVTSEHPLFRLYTSGSTGKPKGVIHSSGGYLCYASLTHKEIFAYETADVYACVADIGWITGHTYVVYGPLANGATTVLFESIPTYPDAGRYWQMVEEHKINQFYTAPTAIRLLMKEGGEHTTKYDLSSLKILGSVGEPINPEAWKWYSEEVGKGKCPIVDTWWQTETGGVLITPFPNEMNAKPGAATRPFYGVEPVLLDASSGEEIIGNDVNGILALKGSIPGFARTLADDHDRFLDTYFRPYPG